MNELNLNIFNLIIISGVVQGLIFSFVVLTQKKYITDNTNNNKAFANKYPNTNHYIIACNAIGQFSGNNNRAFNIRHGNLSILCNTIN